MNLAVMDTKTNKVTVFAGRQKLHSVKFDRALDTEELEEMRVDPTKFLQQIGAIGPDQAPGVA